MRFFRTASKIAWRELKATPSRFLFVIIAVAVGVGALSGVKGFGAAFSSMLLRNAKQLTASDLSAQIWGVPTEDQLQRLHNLARQTGSRLTRVTETVSMAAPERGGIPQMVSVKAVDPAVYPFYGALTLAPAKPLEELLSSTSVLVNQELEIRLRVRPGDAIRLGGKTFSIAGTLVTEPDRLASGFGPGMRVLLNRQALDRTGLIQPGSRAAQRFLFKLNPDANLDSLKASLESILPHPRLTDYRDGDPAVERGIERSTTFLSLLSLIALIVGSLGVGMAMHSHLQQKMDTIAIMKSVGARSRQIMTVYVIQTLWLGIAGGLIGVAVGAVVQRSFPVLIHRVLSLLPQVSWDWSFSLQGFALGILATLLFTIPPLVGIREIRPGLVFRREMADAKNLRRQRLVPSLISGLAILAGFAAIAVWLSNSWTMGAYFVGGLAASLVLLTLTAALLLRLMRWLVQRSGRKLPASFRHGFANLYRPGTHAASVLVALGIGVMFTLSTYLIENTVIRDVTREGPGRAGNVFLLDIRPAQRTQIVQFVGAQPGVNRRVNLVGYFVARVLSRNGIATQNLPLPRHRKDRLQTTRISIAATLPENVQIKSGSFWKPDATEPQLAISEDESREYEIEQGDRIQLQAAGRLITAPVVAIFSIEKRAAIRFDVLFPEKALAATPAIYFGSAQVQPDKIPDLELALFEKFPTLTVMNLADILQRIQQAVDQVALVIRFLAAFAILAGIIILSSSIAGTRHRRIREVAILKTLGATRKRISGIFSIEFTILGAVSGFIGGLLANGFSSIIANKFIETQFTFDWRALLIATIATAILANAAGWLASMKILDLRPLEVLRSE
ncbi:MAG TPA: FtsX-like permease family protein [Bryobacteraceae bacterium]|nr:FtsX-like permease family protein [Bryobacteraceae bacterium]